MLGSQNQLPTVLRNNGDGTFIELHPFSEVAGLRDFVWSDIDGDGDPDAVLIDSIDANKVGHHLHIFINERSGQFRQRALPPVATVKAISTADLNQDGVLDLLAIQDNGAIVRISDKDEEQWDIAQVASFDEASKFTNRDFYLSVVDLDNNGANDLLLTFGRRVQISWGYCLTGNKTRNSTAQNISY